MYSQNHPLHSPKREEQHF